MTDSAGNLIGRQLGNYRLTRLLGRGGFASVYLGEHIHLGTLAAVKVLHTQIAISEMERFRTEARTIASLDHPHIVHVMDFGLEDTTPFLVMNYAPNGSLRMLHPEGIPLPLSTVTSYAKQIADALQYAHDRKVIHRDIKPDNILLSMKNELLLSDFGIALILQTSYQQSTKDFTGTIAYMAPEQSRGKPVASSDQYALGIMIYEWLCGVRPFQGTFIELLAQHAMAPVPSLCEKMPVLPLEVEQVVLRALAKDPLHRFPNVKVFADALEQAGTVRKGGTPYISTFQPSRSPQQVQQPSQALPVISPNHLDKQRPSDQQAPMASIRSGYTNQSKKSSQTKNQGMQTPLYNTPQATPSPNTSYPQQPFVSPAGQNAQLHPTMPGGPIPYIYAAPVSMTPPKSQSSKTCLTVVGVLALALIGLCILSTGLSMLSSVLGHTSTTPGATNSNTFTAGTPITSQLPTPLPTISDTLYSENWSKGTDHWTGSSEWKWFKEGFLGSDGTDNSGYLVLSPYQLQTGGGYAIEAQIQWLSFTHSILGDFGVVVESDSGGNGYTCGIDLAEGAIIAKMESGTINYNSYLKTQQYGLDNGYHLYRVEIKNDTISFFIDGQLIVQAQDNTYTSGSVGLRAYDSEINVRSFQVLKL